MFGYITKEEARSAGFTHHGLYYGVPIWISDDACPMVAAKWAPMEFMITVGHYIEHFMQSLHPDCDRGFLFYYGKRIE